MTKSQVRCSMSAYSNHVLLPVVITVLAASQCYHYRYHDFAT